MDSAYEPRGSWGGRFICMGAGPIHPGGASDPAPSRSVIVAESTYFFGLGVDTGVTEVLNLAMGETPWSLEAKIPAQPTPVVTNA